jgi:hypothetical protein
VTSLSSLYSRLANTTNTLLAQYGQPITLVQNGASTYDPTQAKNTTTQTTYVGTGALLDFSMSSPSVTTMRGTEIQQGDKRLFLSVQGTLNGVAVQMPRPDTDDQIIDSNGVVYNVQATTTVDPSGVVPVVHECHVRGVPTS